MDDRQRAYLGAMGFVTWEPRRPAAAVSLEPARLALAWPELEQQARACTACALHASRTQVVFGAGSQTAAWMFVGEAPGADEDRLGEPFVGRAGQLLTSMLFALGLNRADVYIANVLKCRPPANRNPADEEVAACASYLERQIQLVGPQILVAMGRFAAHSLLKTEEPLSRLRGRLHDYAGIPLLVTYHPAYLLRNPVDKRKVWEDLVLGRARVAAR